jgi:protein MpaA
MRAIRRILVICLGVLVVAGAGGSAPRDPIVKRTILLGRSVDGRPIVAVETGDPDNPARTLVVGCIHGNECAGTAVARLLIAAAPPAEQELVVVSDLNPDGAAAGTRGNAHGVDLNRNFPAQWRSLTGVYYSGIRPLSEPETRIGVRLVERVRPDVSIWFHQHLDVVDDSSGNRTLEARFARVAGMRMATLSREPGSAVTWESRCFAAASPFVVELPAGALAPPAAERLVHAVHAVAAWPFAHLAVPRCADAG